MTVLEVVLFYVVPEIMQLFCVGRYYNYTEYTTNQESTPYVLDGNCSLTMG